MPLSGLTNGTSVLPAAQPESASTLDVYNAASLASITALLSSLHTRDSAIDSRLQTLVRSQSDLSRDLGKLDLLRGNLGTNLVNTRRISNEMLDGAAETARKLSSQVKELDLEKKRVEETLEVVEKVAELKACVQGVVGSMGAPQDWEAAAGYIARANKIEKRIVEGSFAARTVPSVEVPDAPGITIESAKESLCGLFLREFEKAAEEGDGVKVTRFFKLFPLIGREEMGLDVYGRYVCQGVAGNARGNLRDSGKADANGAGGFFYANALTKLFEHIAQIVENHGQLVARHYGSGRMVRVVERLQVEADVQGGIILDTWADERNVDRRLTDVKSYPFSFLVQSFVPAQRNTGSPRTNSPANGRPSEDEGVDMKEVGGLLSELAIMLGRWSLYTRFLASKCRVSSESPILQQAISKMTQDQESDPGDNLTMPGLLTNSALHRKVSARLISPFNIMTMFYFRRSVEKAFQLDNSPTLTLNPSKPLNDEGPFIISAVDDVMYMVSAVLQQSMATSQRDVIAEVIPTISRVLGSDFVGMIQRKMRDESYPKPAPGGTFPPEDKIIAFILLINSLDVANNHVAQIISARLSPPESNNGAQKASTLQELFPFSHDATFITGKLNNLQTTFSARTSELNNEAIQALFNQVVKVRLRPILQDTFRDVDYALSRPPSPDSDDPVDPDLVSHRFSTAWDNLMKPIKRIMRASPYSSLLDKTAEYLATKVLEKRIWSLAGKMSPEGAQRMERDFGGIVGVVASGRYSVREVFGRVSQLAMVVNMDDEEWEAVCGETGDEEMVWVLSLEERLRARSLINGDGEYAGARQRRA